VVALCVAVTALPVALRILSSFGLQNTKLAQVTIAGALLADVVVLLALGILLPLAHDAQSSLLQLLYLSSLKLPALLALVASSAWLCHKLHHAPALQTRIAQSSLSLLLILALAAASDALGLHFAIGAFLGALAVAEHQNEARFSLRPQLDSMSNLIFAPLFLACQGTHFSTSSLLHPAFMLWLVLLAVISKLIGGYWSARLQGLPLHEARGVAIVMNARGVMEMVVASIAYRAGLVDQALFSTLLMLGMLTTLLTPLLLKQWQQRMA
jgi:Kef-type K+ transport system membrane component KefB